MGSPAMAWNAFIAISVVVTIGLGIAMGPLGTYAFLGSMLGLGIVLIYIAMNVGLVRYCWREERATFSYVRHAAIPLVCSLLLLLPIYGLVWPRPEWPYNLVPYIVVLWIVAGVAFFARLRSRSPETLERMGRVWGDPDAKTPDAVKPQRAGNVPRDLATEGSA
jgi:hypothetical protein